MEEFITVENVEISTEVSEILRGELFANGMDGGSLLIGWIQHMPDSVYLLWTASGQPPAAITVPASQIGDLSAAPAIAQKLIAHWRKSRR